MSYLISIKHACLRSTVSFSVQSVLCKCLCVLVSVCRLVVVVGYCIMWPLTLALILLGLVFVTINW